MYRKIYQKMQQWKGKEIRKPLLFKGARQVGKTYLLNEFGKKEFPEFHYFNFEKEPQLRKAFEGSLEPLKIKKQLEYLTNKKIDVGSDLIIFDEIQACPLALTSLKYFCEDLSSAFVCAAGSLLGLFSEDPSFPVGKVEFMPILPMDFSEFLMAFNEDSLLTNYIEDPSEALHEKLWNRYTDYLVVGGLPEAVHAFAKNEKSEDEDFVFETVAKIHSELINGYIADMAKHCGKENAMFLQRLWQNSADKIGQNHSEKFKFKNVFPGKKTYADFAGPLDWLNKAGLIHIIPLIEKIHQPLSLVRKENTFKIFSFDVGILNHLKSIPAAELKRYDFTHKGFIAENFILQEIIANFKRQTSLYTYRSGLCEIEFVYENQGILTPIEVKAGQNLKAKSLKVFMSENKQALAYRFSRKSLTHSFDLQTKQLKINRIFDYPLYLAAKVVGQ
jgi:predicted AAA+ superfamily ATPase